MINLGSLLIGFRTMSSLLPLYLFKRVSKKGPIVLRIEITNKCNINCKMCDREAMQRKLLNMEMDLFKKVIDEAVSLDIPAIGLNRFGEPTMHPQLLEMVRYAKDKGVTHLSFSTNATLLTEELSRSLIESRCLDEVACSIDGNSTEVYNKIRKGADFEKVVKNVENFIRIRNEMGLRKPLVQINTILMKPTEKEIGQTVKRWRKLADRVWVIPIMEYGNIKGLGINYLNIRKDVIRRYTCPQLAYMMVIYADGGTGVCCAGDSDEEINVGDLNKQTISEVWNGTKINEIRNIHFKKDFSILPICANCDLTFPPTHWVKYFLFSLYKSYFN